MKIYTKTGDVGTTALYGGRRVSKDALRVGAYGTVDEANAALGLARAHLGELADDFDAPLAALQDALFDVGADLATPNSSPYRNNITPLDPSDVTRLETMIDRLEQGLTPLRQFILPGGHPAAAALQLARAVVRRAEREVVHVQHDEGINSVNAHVAVFLNRLSDLLFVMARAVNARAGLSEEPWHVRGRDRS